MDFVEYIKNAPLKEFKRGEVLIQGGDTSEAFLVIREGYVKVASINSAGSERLVWIAGRYDFAPTEHLFSVTRPVQFFYTALTDGSYYHVNKAKFLAYAKASPDLMYEIAQGMSGHYDDLLQHINTLDASTVKERLLRALVYLAQRVSADADVDLSQAGLSLTHSDLASFVGSTRETVSLILGGLRREGFITYKKRQMIIHTDKINHLLDTS